MIKEAAKTNVKGKNNSTDSVGIIGNLVRKNNFGAIHNIDLKIKQAIIQQQKDNPIKNGQVIFHSYFSKDDIQMAYEPIKMFNIIVIRERYIKLTTKYISRP